jgi:hypothetical protein
MNASARCEDLLGCLDCASPAPAGIPSRKTGRLSSVVGRMLLTGLACAAPYSASAADAATGSQPAAATAAVPPTAPSPPLPPASAASAASAEKPANKSADRATAKPADPNAKPKGQAGTASAWQTLSGWFSPPTTTSQKPPEQKAVAGKASPPSTVAGVAAAPVRPTSPPRTGGATVVGRFEPESGTAGHFVTDSDEPASMPSPATRLQPVPRQTASRPAPAPQPGPAKKEITSVEDMLSGLWKPTGQADPDAEQSATVTDEQVSLVAWLSDYYSGTGSGHHGNSNICLTDSCCPKWEAQVDALFLWQGNIPSRTLYFDTASGVTALDANQLYAPAAIAPRYALTYHRDDCRAIEVNYFQIWGFNAQQQIGPQVDAIGEGVFTANNLVGPDYDRVAAARATSSANIQSLEVNLRRTDGGIVEWISGFRWLQWGQELALGDVTVENGVISGGDTINVDTLNNLYGWQWGGDMMLWNAGRWLRVNGIGKAGVYYNHQASQSTNYNDFFNPPINASAANDTVAFVGETGINASLALTNWLSWRAGYTVFWLGGMAVPARQLGLTDINTSTTQVNTNGSVMLHGVTTGLEARW